MVRSGSGAFGVHCLGTFRVQVVGGLIGLQVWGLGFKLSGLLLLRRGLQMRAQKQ